MKFLSLFLYPILVLIFIGCGSGGGDTSSLSIESNSSVLLLNPATDNFSLSLELNTSLKDVFLTFTNIGASTFPPTVIGPSISDIVEYPNIQSQLDTKITNMKNNMIHMPLKEMNQEALNILNQPISKSLSSFDIQPISPDIEGGKKTFIARESLFSSNTINVPSTNKKVRTADGKTLNIWVADNSLDGLTCTKTACITDQMVDVIADKFLQLGDSNDIYNWVTNIYGEEWGPHGDVRLINDNNEITILLLDIFEDNSTNGGVLGYFDPNDTYKSAFNSNSNQRMMFYIDAPLFAQTVNLNGLEDGIWSADDFWPTMLIGTLAHEFQHMIHWYQKTVLRSGLTALSDTWINEMLSELTEDLVSQKLDIDGPRGVSASDGSAGSPNNTHGRLPSFNNNMDNSLTIWGNESVDYSMIYSFGAYLIRNYGGAQLVHDILQNNFLDENSVVFGVNEFLKDTNITKTFPTLLREWGAAVMLSDQTNAPKYLRYNTGTWIDSEFNNTMYPMGSINFFNYSTGATTSGPKIQIDASNTALTPTTNTIFQVGTDLNGTLELNITKNSNTEVNVIIK